MIAKRVCIDSFMLPGNGRCSALYTVNMTLGTVVRGRGDRQCISMWSRPRSQFNVLNESGLYGAGEVTQLPRSLNHWQSDRENKFIKPSMKADTSKWTVKKLMGIRVCDDSE